MKSRSDAKAHANTAYRQYRRPATPSVAVGVIDAGIGEKGLDRDHSDQMLPCFGSFQDWIDLRPVENARACAFE
jgi:hypothetical protein